MSPGREVLVTGAAGFIGRHLLRRLSAEGRRVTAVDIDPPPPEVRREAVRFERLDVRDTSALEPLLPGGGTVYHLASVHLEVGADESHFREVNVRAAADLVEACGRAGVRRMVHTSSVGIYGHVEDPPADEDSPKRPRSPYERTKLAGERAVRERARTVSTELVVLRPAWVYGPGCPRTAKLVDALRRGRFFYIGEGRNLRHPLHIDDMVEALLLAGTAPGISSGRAFLVGGPGYMPLEEMVGAFCRSLGAPEPGVHVPRSVGWGLGLAMEGAFALTGGHPPFSRRSLAFFENDMAFDIGAARRELGFVPEVDLEEGIRRTLDVPSREAVA